MLIPEWLLHQGGILVGLRLPEELDLARAPAHAVAWSPTNSYRLFPCFLVALLWLSRLSVCKRRLDVTDFAVLLLIAIFIFP